jgi:hypothetical protein
VITAVPADTPRTTPVPATTVATDVLPLLQVPPLVILVRVVVEPEHIDADPRIADGDAFTVTVILALPPGSVYEIIAVPAVKPETIPVPDPTVATVLLLLLHTPPVVASASVADDPAQTKEVPVTGAIGSLRRTDTVFESRLATAISGNPSPSRSASVAKRGLLPVVKSALAASDPLVILPLAEVLRNNDTLLELELDTTRSTFPSPSTSPIDTLYGALPVAKSTLAANEPLVIDPELDVLRNIDKVPLTLFTTAISILPSPSTSPIATL